MIARFWSAQATEAQAPAYVDHLTTRVLPVIRRVDGYAGAMLLERRASHTVEIIVITLWRSLDSIRGFAGADLEAAVVTAEAASLLTEFDRRVRHYEVVVKDDVQSAAPGPSHFPSAAMSPRTSQSVFWRRLDRPGHESARLLFDGSSWHLAGTAVFADKQQPCRLEYLVVCDSKWQTLSGRVAGWVGEQTVEIEMSVDAARRWWLNGAECPAVAGCVDLDLHFSPSTNLLPIRRLDLAIGQGAEVRAAWLRFPGFTLEPLDQLYRRIARVTYRYESAGGRFVTELQVNTAGFVTEYPGFWAVETTS